MCIAYFGRWSRGGMFHESFVLVERGRWQLKELLKKHIIYSGSRILYFYITCDHYTIRNENINIKSI
jgi:hypothetical protein